MNETIKLISGVGVIVSLAILPITLMAIIAYKIYRKFRPAKAQVGIEAHMTRMQKQPSLSSKPVSPQGMLVRLIMFVLLVILWGLMNGFVSGILSQLFPIVFIYPVVMGINSGKMIVDFIQRAKLRVTSQMIAVSLLSAVITYGAYHYCAYLGFQLQASVQIFEGFSEATEEENLGVAKTFLDYALEEETGHSGFVGYMLYRAQEGVSIGRVYSSNRANLGAVLTWLYWFEEFGIILGVTLYKGKNAIGRPFCETCGNWYGQEKHLGGTVPANEPVLLDLIRQKDFAGLGNLMEKNAELPSLEIYFQGCEVCGKSQSQLVVRHAFQTAKGKLKFTDASQAILQPAESALLLSQLSFSGD